MAFNTYPLSSENGRDIPIDVQGPISCTIHAVTNAAMAGVINKPNMSDSLVELVSDTNCIVSFSATPVAYTIEVPMDDAIFLQANVPKIVKPTSDVLSAINDTSPTGALAVSIITAWDKLSTPEQLDYA